MTPSLTALFADAETVAVVGNSPSLLDAERGEEIDQAGAVVRMNAAPVEGYERHVGRRTTARVLNVMLQRGRKPLHTDTPVRWIETLRDLDVILRAATPRVHTRARVLLHASCMPHVMPQRVREQLYLRHGSQIGHKPSTGLLTIYMLREMGKQVRLYGFDGFAHPSGRLHYFEGVTAKEKQPTHRGSAEIDLMEAWDEVTNVTTGLDRRVPSPLEALAWQ